MKTKFYFAAMLCAMTAYGNNASADNTPTAQNAATETWMVTQNTRTPKQDHEYPYYASANITILIGANEVWEAPTQLDGGSNWYLHAQGNPQFGNKNSAGYKGGKGEPQCIAMPDEGNYFHFLFHTKGKITLKYATKLSKADSKQYIYIAKPTNETITVGSDQTVKGVANQTVEITPETTGLNVNTVNPKTDNENFQITGVAGYSFITVTLDAEAGDEYCIWGEKAENFSLGGFTFDVDPNYVFTPYEPSVHLQIEEGKDPSTLNPTISGAPTGVKNITFMYGGWANHENAVKAATWDETGKKWNFHENGTENTSYTISGNTYKDSWNATKQESELTVLDGYKAYTEGCGNAPKNEYGNSFSPSNASTPNVGIIPCRGTYYKFEPQMDGLMTAYVRQNATEPVYLVDQSGKPQQSVDFKAGDATITENATNYSYSTDKLSAARYSYELKAGKTYVMFQNNANLGFYGFTFGADAETGENVTIGTDGYSYAQQNEATVTLNRAMNMGQWNTICLPFSMTEKQVRDAFGDDARVAEFNRVDGNVANFGMFYYQLINGGMPYLIKPSKQVAEGTQIKGVTIDAENPIEINGGEFSFVGTYDKTTMPANSHFLGGSDGKLYYITQDKEIGGLKAFLKPVSPNVTTKLSIGFNGNGGTTAIEAISDTSINVDGTKGMVYNLNGQAIGNGYKDLNKGIYIVNGKKIVVK